MSSTYIEMREGVEQDSFFFCAKNELQLFIIYIHPLSHPYNYIDRCMREAGR